MPAVNLDNINVYLRRLEPIMHELTATSSCDSLIVYLQYIQPNSFAALWAMFIKRLKDNDIVLPLPREQFFAACSTHVCATAFEAVVFRPKSHLLLDAFSIVWSHVSYSIISPRQQLPSLPDLSNLPPSPLASDKPYVSYVPVRTRITPALRSPVCEYSPEVFLAFCLLKDRNIITNAIYLSPATLDTLPDHTSFSNIAVIPHDETTIVIL